MMSNICFSVRLASSWNTQKPAKLLASQSQLILAVSYLIYVLSIETTPTNVTLLSWPTFKYEDAFRIDFLLFNINIGITAVQLILDLLLLFGSFRQIPQFLNAWASCNSTLLIYDITNIIRSGGLSPISIIKIIIIGICLYFVLQTAKVTHLTNTCF